MLPYSGDLVAGQASRMPESRAYTEGFRDSLASQCPSRKKDLNFFFCQNSGFLKVLATWFGDFITRGSSRNFRGSLHDLLMGGPSSCKKHLDKIFKILSLRCLATCPGDLHVTCFNREKCVSCASWTIFKTF